MCEFQNKDAYFCDMDGVIYHGEKVLDGVKEFVDWLKKEDKKYLFLTNCSSRSPRELKARLKRMGLDVDESHFYTSGQATAQFLSSQKKNCTAYVIGDAGLIEALRDEGIEENDVDPDYVVIGETDSYNYERMCRAVYHVRNGARLVGTNPDMSGPSERGIVPACGALVSPIEAVSERRAYYVGKPNSLMMRNGLKLLNVHSKDVGIIGDRMDTDILAGIEAGMDTCLVLSGVTDESMLDGFSYRPDVVLNGVGDIPLLR